MNVITAAKRDNKASDNVNVKDANQFTDVHTNMVAPTAVYYFIEVA